MAQGHAKAPGIVKVTEPVGVSQVPPGVEALHSTGAVRDGMIAFVTEPSETSTLWNGPDPRGGVRSRQLSYAATRR
jgi:hypothetical protein